MNRRTPHWQADVPHTASNMNAVTNGLWILAPGCTNTRWRWNIPTDSWAGMMQNLWCFSFLFVQQEDVETCRHVMTANCYVFHCNCCKFKRTTRRRWNIPLRQWTLAINDFGPTRPMHDTGPVTSSTASLPVQCLSVGVGWSCCCASSLL